MYDLLFEITKRCNLACPFCYLAHGCEAQGEAGRGDEQESVLRVLERLLSQVELRSIVFIGGEPTVSPALIQAAEMVQRSGKRIAMGMASNAVALTPQLAHRLVQLGIRSVEVPWFTLDAGVYRDLTGSDLALLRSGVAAAMQAGMAVSAGVTLLKQTVGELNGVLEHLFLLGVGCISLFAYVNLGRAAARGTLFGPEKWQLLEALALADNFAATTGQLVVVGNEALAAVKGSSFPNLRRATCGASRRVVDSRGNLLNCELSRVVVGNVLEETRVGELFERAEGFFGCGECVGG